MKLTPEKIHTFLFFKLPSAWFCGVRVEALSKEVCTTYVKHRWINQNPFQSMYFAVQAMAAELATGALVMQGIRASNQKISMLVAENKATFLKKATGKITFTCADGEELILALQACLQHPEGSTLWMKSIGKNENDEVVSTFYFKWTLRRKQ